MFHKLMTLLHAVAIIKGVCEMPRTIIFAIRHNVMYGALKYLSTYYSIRKRGTIIYINICSYRTKTPFNRYSIMNSKSITT